MISLANR